MPDWMTSHEATAASGYDLQHIRRLAREGKIGAERKGRDWWIDRDKLMQYVNTMNELGNRRFDPRGLPDVANEDDGRAG
jgi:excisionase family DNA binding protein